MLTKDQSNGTRQTGILNDWDRAQGLDSLTSDHARVSVLFSYSRSRLDSRVVGHLAVRFCGDVV